MGIRMSAEERKEQVIRAAVAEFSRRGLDGTSTADIAKKVGVSQPYLFRLFPTKKALFIAACVSGAARINGVFAAAAEGKYGIEALAAMGDAYGELLRADHELLGMQLQQLAACADDEVQTAVRGCMREVWDKVAALSGAPTEILVDFFAKGMLINMLAATSSRNGMVPEWEPIMEIIGDPEPTIHMERWDAAVERDAARAARLAEAGAAEGAGAAEAPATGEQDDGRSEG